MGKKETKEKKDAEAAKKLLEAKQADEASDEETGGDDGEHDDAAADRELIKKMIAEYVGEGTEGEAMDESEAAEMEALAKEAFEAHKEMGASEKEAYERAGHALKLAKHMACKQSAAEKPKEADEADEADEAKKVEGADDEADEDAKDEDAEKGDKKKESAKVIALEKKLLETQGKLAAISATVSKDLVSKYVDTKLAESKQPRLVTKQFREAAGEIRSKADFDSKWSMFQEGLKNSRTELDWGLLQEKATSTEGGSKSGNTKGLDFSKLAED